MTLSVRWGTLGSFRAEKRRPQFRCENGKASDGSAAQPFPWWKRELRIISSLPIILFFAGVLAAILTAIFILEAFVTQFYRGPLHDYIVRY
jgi:anoctamin-10